MNHNYYDKMNSVRLSDAGKAHMAAVLTSQGQKPISRPRRGLHSGLVAAAIAGVLTITVGAVTLITPVLREYLGGGQAYAENVQTLNLSQTVNGYTITLTDCTGDDEFLYLGIELTGPEGTILDPNLQIGDNNETVTYSGYEGGIGSGGGMRLLEDHNPADNKLQFAWVRWVEQPLSGRDMSISFHNLIRWVGNGERVVEVEGDWSFGPFRLNFSERTIDLAPNIPMPLLGGETTIASVKITPLHVEVILEGGNLVAIHTTGPEKDGCWGLCTQETKLTLYGMDGAKWDLPSSNSSGSWISTANDRTRVYFSFNQLLNLDDLGYIEVNEVKIPVT